MIPGSERERLRFDVFIERDAGIPVWMIATERRISERTVYRLLAEQREIDAAGPACRVCGCSEYQPCVNEWGDTCGWAEPDLCSSCAEDAA